MSYNKTNFRLIKLKTTKGQDSLELKWEYTHSSGDVTQIDKESKTSCATPHPSLTTHLNSLKAIYANEVGLMKPIAFMRSQEFKATVGQKAAIDRLEEQILADVSILGVTLTGGNNKNAITISGSYQKTKMVTPDISFKSNEKGEEVERLYLGLQDEGFEYVYLNKKAELELFDDD